MPCDWRNGTPRRTSRSAMSVAAISSSAAAAASRSRSKRDRLEHPGAPPAGTGRACRRRRTGAPCPPACPCCRSAGGRAARRGARQARGDARRLGAQQLGRVGVLLLRHDRGARRPGVGDLGRSRTPREDHSTISAPSRERCVAQVAAAARKSSTKSRLETASIEFGATRGEAELARRRSPRSVAKFTPASAPAPSGSSRVDAEHELEAPRVAAEHPEVGEQVVREVDGLRALQVRVAGHRPVLVALGELRRARSAGAAACRSVCSACARVNIATSVATWSLRERAVCSLPPTGPTISVSRRSTAMWMSSSSSLERRTSPPSSSSSTRVEAGEQRVAVGVGDDPRRREHRRVRARLLDVVRARGASRSRSRRSAGGRPGAGARRSATRARHHAGMEVVVRAARPGRPGRRSCSSSRPRRTTPRSPAARATRRALLRRLYPRARAHRELGGLPRRAGRRRGGRRARRLPRRRRRRARAALRAADARAHAAVAPAGAAAPPAARPRRSRRTRRSDVLYVDALATDPDVRRRGVATALLDEADRLAARRRACRPSRSTRGSRTAPRGRSTSAAASPGAGCGRRPTSASPARSAARASSATSRRAR